MSGRSPFWSGPLTPDSHEEITDRLREVLDGEYFTMVLCNSYSEESEKFSSVEVYPSQRLVGLRPYTTGDLVGISWGTQRLTMGISTRARTRKEAYEGKPHNYVNVSFSPGRVQIDHYSPAGYRLLWVFAVERHEEEA